MPFRTFRTALFAAVACGAATAIVFAAKSDTNEIPHGYSKPPNAAYTPEQAMAKMQLPPGFKIECVAHEPDLINPTSFTFDDQGRMWVTESIEYPRADAGPGQDRVKIFESTKHDGHFDKFTRLQRRPEHPLRRRDRQRRGLRHQLPRHSFLSPIRPSPEKRPSRRSFSPDSVEAIVTNCPTASPGVPTAGSTE